MLFCCKSNSKKKDSVLYDDRQTAVRITRIVETQNNAEAPSWVTEYFFNDLQTIDRTRDDYVFIAEETSSNLKVLLQWEKNFFVEQDIRQLVFMRVYNRFIDNIRISPDEQYGIFFERVLKQTANVFWPDAQQIESFWAIVEYPRDSAQAGSVNFYKLLILNTIPKKTVQAELQSIMNGIQFAKKERPDKDQMIAINRIKNNFFDNF
ncbi:hypothetical protein FACS1894190_09560 [Spirochaetia bacterium]|nr:hypothetical protein FACS1894190_09560 [Spirochaetia bacterium]